MRGIPVCLYRQSLLNAFHWSLSIVLKIPACYTSTDLSAAEEMLL